MTWSGRWLSGPRPFRRPAASGLIVPCTASRVRQPVMGDVRSLGQVEMGSIIPGDVRMMEPDEKPPGQLDLAGCCVAGHVESRI